MPTAENRTSPESFKDEVHRAFTAYIQHATYILTPQPSLKDQVLDDSLKLAYIDRGYRLRLLAVQAEDSTQFGDLSSAMIRAFPRKVSDTWSGELKNFFRRSRFYFSVFSGERQSPDELFDRFWSGLLYRKAKNTNLRILFGADFTSRVIDCGNFIIQKFTKDELDTLTGREINEIFYPSSRLDTSIVSQYWLIVEEPVENSAVNVQTDVVMTEAEIECAFVKSWNAPRIVKLQTPDRVVQLLAIHDWTPDFTEDELQEMNVTQEDVIRNFPGIRVSDTFRVSDDLFSEPLYVRAGDVQPRDISDYFFPISEGQEIKIKETAKKGKKLLKIVEGAKPHWNFISLAMEYFGKAFLTDRSLEQLLWNIAVLDCLLSDNTEVMQSMKRRIGNVLGAAEQDRGDIRKEFAELYDFRSDFVHGNALSEEITEHHLAKARELARRVLAWFIDYLLWVDEDFRQREISYEQYPRREELLYVLDFKRASLNRLNRFIGRLPTAFPKFRV